MPKVKAKSRPQEVAAEMPTPERMRRGDLTERRIPLMEGERRTALKGHRFASRATRWRKDGWVNDAQAASLIRFETLTDACFYGSTRSCCDNSVRGNGWSGLPDKVAAARSERARAANAVACQVSLMAVVEMLASEDDPEELRARLFGPGALVKAKAAIWNVASDLHRYFGA